MNPNHPRQIVIPPGFREGPPRVFVPVSQPTPGGLKGGHGGPLGYVETADVEQCPIDVVRAGSGDFDSRESATINAEGIE